MYLKRLELRGFKSFAERTEILFRPGINIIVGPNGCGKSNIVDSIRWVLGESNIRHLRGQKNEDVIFTGTDNKRPLGLAQVDITIDNEDKGLPTEYSEVTVTRKVFRSGESEFFINKVPVRLKDVQELFTGTGLGKKGYSIIGQGELDQVLNARPFERRLILEEASGIIKYRHKMEEAKSRLALTEQDMLRVGDILRELDERQKELAVKAQKTARYRELRGELDELEKNILASELAILDQDLSARRQELEGLEADWRQSLAEADSQEEELATINLRIENLEQELSTQKEEKYAVGTEISRIKGELKLAEERIRNAAARIEGLTQDEQKYLKMLDKLQEDLHQGGDNLAREEENWRGKVAELQALEEEVERLGEIRSRNEETYEDTRTELIDKLQQEAKLKNELVDKMERARRLGEKAERCRVELAEKKAALTRFDESEALLLDSLAQLRLELSTAEENKRRLERKRAGIAAEVAAKEQDIERLTAEMIKAEHLLASYRQMDNEYVGYSGGVRSVLKTTRKHPSVLPGILGVVGDILEVPQGLENAVEIALGRGIESIIVRGEKDARRAIQFLKKDSLGRVTFLPLDLLRVAELGAEAKKKITGYPGVVGWASELVSYPADFEKAIKYLLGRVVVVENLEAGVNVYRTCSLPVRLVTLEGELLNYSGAITGGRSGGRNPELLKRKNRIKEQTLYIEEKKLQVETLQVEAGKLKEVMNQLQDNIDQDSRQEEQLNLRRKMLELELEKLVQDRERLTEDVNRLTEESNRYIRETKMINEIVDATNRQHQDLLAETEKLAAQVENLRKKQEEQYRRYEVLQERSASLREYIQAKENELKTLRQNFLQFNEVRESYLSTINDCREHKNRLQKEIEREESRIRELTARRLERQGRLQEIEKSIANLGETIRELYEETEKLKSSLTFHKQVSSEKEERIRGLELRITRLEADMENRLSSWLERYGQRPAEMEGAVVGERKRKEIRSRIENLRLQLEKLGPVDPGAEEEYREVSERFRFLQDQYRDIAKARNSLYRLLDETQTALSGQFASFLQLANDSLNQTFTQIFGGGNARLDMEGDITRLESGVEITVKLPGKRRQNLDLLSGGERALTCIAFIFALLRLKPAPFCLLDEIDASLDDVNLVRFSSFLQRLAGHIQFILVTHRQGTIESGETIYGVTMPEEGVSRVLSVSLREAEVLAG